MLRVIVTPRPGSTLRCAYCHGEAVEPRPCLACATVLHVECWTLSGTCPTPGCALAVRLQPATRPRAGADAVDLAMWLAMLAGWWAGLVIVVPAFERMFREVGVNLDWPTEALLSLSGFAASPLGWITAAATAVASFVGYRLARPEPACRLVLNALVALSFVAIPLAVAALLSPCGPGIQKL